MKKISTTVIFSAILLASCTPKSTNTSTVATKSNEQQAQGKTIFENSCAKCHQLPNPTAFTSIEWVGIMNSMAPKAKLTDEQHQWVYDYVVSVK